LATLTFAGAWIPAHAATLVPGGWSISVEMWFYLVAPLLVPRIRTLHHALWFSLAAIMLRCAINESLVAWAGAPSASFAAFLYFWLPNQLPMFALGTVAYQAYKSLGRTARERALVPETNAPGFSMAGGGHGLFFLAAGVYLVAAGIQGFKALLPFHVIFGFGFLLVFLHLMAMPGSPVANRPLIALGRISYSAYFAHFFVIERTEAWAIPLLRGAVASPALQYLVFLASTLALTALVSAALHRWVELPGQALGRSLIRRIQARAAAAPVSAG
jgi:peptidoglycan/LPS O-acetylase OafA/YrhL